MIVVHLLTNDEDSLIDKSVEKYKARLARSESQNPIIEDVEYGIDFKCNSSANPPSMPKNFEQDIVKV